VQRLSLVSELTHMRSLSDYQDAVSMLQQIFASASLLSTRNVGFFRLLDFSEKSRVENYYIELAGTVCKVIQTISHSALPPNLSESCTCICISFLASFVETTIASAWRVDVNFSQRVAQVFAEYDTVRSLAFQAGWQRPAPTVDGSSPVSDLTKVVLPVLDLFTKIASTGDPNMLGRLNSDNVALALLSQCSQAFSRHSIDEDPTMRGYLQDGGAFPSQQAIGREDPRHKIWRSSMELLGACLRSSRQNQSGVDTESSKIFRKVAIDFLKENKGVAFECLQLCKAVEFGPHASKQQGFTLNLLREAKLIFSIVSELCDENAVEMFDRQCPELSVLFVAESAAVAVSLSTFLGASGASRDIFNALDEVEAADVMTIDQGSQLATLGPVYRLLAGGLQNAKHEAIRYSSHFVLNCTRAVTREDREAQEVVYGNRNPAQNEKVGSLASLESTCYSGVTNKFAFQMGLEAAECLFAANSVLWKKHPASSSFEEFSPEEAQMIDCMSFVKPGMVIAFRAKSSGGLFLPSNEVAGGQSMPEQKIQYARVLRSDTVHRKWVVQLQTSNADECVVNETQLAGIEDSSKRICMFAYAATPRP